MEGLPTSSGNMNQPIMTTEGEPKLLELDSANAFKIRMNKPPGGEPHDKESTMNHPMQNLRTSRMPVNSQCCIPEIIFTDFSNTADNNTGEYTLLVFIHYLINKKQNTFLCM